MHDDLGLKSLERRKVNILTKAIREKRLQKLLSVISCRPSVVDKILFSDEKLFMIQEVSNTQNSHTNIGSLKACCSEND